MNKQDEGLFGVCNEVHILVLWVILSTTFVGFMLSSTRLKNLEKKIEESLDNQPIEIKIEGSWERFGKLTFNDSVLTKDD